MQLGTVGPGRTDASMGRLLREGHDCVAFDMSPKPVQELVAEGAAEFESKAVLRAA